MSTSTPTRTAPSPLQQAARFSQALRPSVMGAQLAAVFGGDPRSCHVLDAKFEPDRRATVLYGLDGRLFRGDLPLSDAPADPAADPAADAAADAGAAPAANAVAGPYVLSPSGVRVWPFPHDPDLPGLPPLMVDGAGAGRRAGSTLLRYRPGKRATVLVDPGLVGPGLVGPGLVRAGLERTARQVAKVYHDPAKAAAVAIEAEELSRVSGSCRHLRHPPVVAHLPDRATVIYSALAGRPLEDLVLGAPRDAATMNAVVRAAAALAELHRLPQVSRRRRPVQNELSRFLLRAAGVARVDPRLGEALAALACRLGETAANLPPGCTGLVHGDCKPGQFLVDDDRVVLLDLDHCGISDQAGDPGTFLATLRQRAVQQQLARHHHRHAALSSVTELFLSAYLQAAPDQHAQRIGWHEAVALERKALRCFARAPSSPLAGALVAEAHRCLDGLGLDQPKFNPTAPGRPDIPTRTVDTRGGSW